VGAIRFAKGHGTQNDFVIVPDPDGELDLSPSLVAAICDRRSGVGADGLLRVVRAGNDPAAAAQAGAAEWFMDYRNGDGSLAEMCGNGLRVFARYLVDHALAEPGAVTVATRAGLRRAHLGVSGDVRVEMGPASLASPGASQIEVWVAERPYPAVRVDVGNPHAVVFVTDLAEAGPLREPPVVTPASAYPAGVNVEFVVGVGERHVAMRVHERGAGETRSCGTGACAVMVAAARRDGVPAPATYTVDVPGGRLEVTESASGELTLTGPAVLVAEGELRPDWLPSVTAGAWVAARSSR
jgi:diaminopimelate epimerase